ncbi:ras-domain-containing protein [Xylaria digitata]|nr:ras-domain-containing protein [Xylaria digitata]
MELQIVLELLRDDSAINENDVFPEALRAQVLSVITNCNTVVERINTVLEKHGASISTPLNWVVSGKNEVASLKMSLEAHRGSLNLALEMINISLSKSTKEDTTVIRSDMVRVTQDTTVIRSDMTRIKQDTGQIVQIMEELAVLREIVANIRSSPQAAGSNYTLQQYLDSLTSYAETVVQEDLIQDTQGQEDYDRLRPPFYPNKDAILICFNITDPDSLQNVLEKWIVEVLHFCPKTPYILIGLQKDLRFDPETLEDLERWNQKPVSPEEGENIRKKIGAFSYIECSVKTLEGIEEVFSTAARALKPQRRGRWLRLLKS